MGSNPVPIETFAKDDRIDHLWVIKPLKNSVEVFKNSIEQYIG